MRSKVACAVREGAGYFANPPISCMQTKFILSDQYKKGRD